MASWFKMGSSPDQEVRVPTLARGPFLKSLERFLLNAPGKP